MSATLHYSEEFGTQRVTAVVPVLAAVVSASLEQTVPAENQSHRRIFSRLWRVVSGLFGGGPLRLGCLRCYRLFVERLVFENRTLPPVSSVGLP